ncbi:MAG: 2'-deoxycytidine 5'-triphosphate deaminase [Nanoarchaeota archaeon]|nr:2'-deoxycytidine 5'-triphosphate deaminase [Nanoarchaeota archaeon]
MRQNTTASDRDLRDLISGRKLLIPNPKITYDPVLWKPIIQPSSLDLHLGSEAWQMGGSVRPMKNETVELMAHEHSVKRFNLDENGAEFRRDRIYIISLQESVDIPAYARLRSNPKSSTGRDDLLARLLADRTPQYESISGQYTGRLYLETAPNSFDMILRKGDSLNQIRYSIGNPTMSDEEIRSVMMVRPLIYTKEGLPVPAEYVKVDNGIVLSADLTGEHTNSSIVAYRAKKNCQLPIDFQGVGKHHLHQYFDAIERPQNKQLELEPGFFYLLSTNEAVCLPSAYAAELSQFDHRAGNVTWHYAGFLDPGWGYFPGKEQQGNTITLEVRVHNKAEIIRHGQPIGVMKMERMNQLPEFSYGEQRSSNYSRQLGVRYGKHFFE